MNNATLARESINILSVTPALTPTNDEEVCVIYEYSWVDPTLYNNKLHWSKTFIFTPKKSIRTAILKEVKEARTELENGAHR